MHSAGGGLERQVSATPSEDPSGSSGYESDQGSVASGASESDMSDEVVVVDLRPRTANEGLPRVSKSKRRRHRSLAERNATFVGEGTMPAGSTLVGEGAAHVDKSSVPTLGLAATPAPSQAGNRQVAQHAARRQQHPASSFLM